MPAPLSPDLLLTTAMASIAVREFLIILLPDSVAGPEGWLIRIASNPAPRENAPEAGPRAGVDP